MAEGNSRCKLSVLATIGAKKRAKLSCSERDGERIERIYRDIGGGCGLVNRASMGVLRSRSRQNRPLFVAKRGSLRHVACHADGCSHKDHAMISRQFHLPSAPARRFAVLAASAAVLMLAISGCSKNSSSEVSAAPSGAVVARVNGVDIRESDLALAEEDLGAEIANAPPEAKREHLISYLADVIMVTQAAEKKNIADNPDFKRRLAFLRNKLLMGFELQEEAKAAVSDEALHQTYEDAVQSMRGQEEVHARHILVESEDEAKALLDQLKAGGDFVVLAKEKSKDPGGSDGGDLGYFTKDQMVPEFAEVAFKMYPGQLSNPVKTQFGWHIIKVEDKRTKQAPEFDRVKDQIETFLTRKAQTEFISKLRKSAKIERLDKAGEQSKN
jgi:peptidyl-prolyl cis-trans isomerase C